MNNVVITLLNTNKIDCYVKIQIQILFSKNAKYGTYLHLATNKPKILIEFLNRKLIDIDVTDSLGNTPFMIACENKNKEYADLFFNCEDMDYLHKNNNGKDALMIANSRNTVDVDEKSIKNKKEYFDNIFEIWDKIEKSRDFKFKGGNTKFKFTFK